MHKDKKALAETLRHYKRHILGPLFTEAADTIEELLAEKEEREKPAQWAIKEEKYSTVIDPYGVLRKKYVCPACGEWQTYGQTKYCPNCGRPMQNAPEAHDCHTCKHRTRDMGRECQSCLDAGDFPLWENENG